MDELKPGDHIALSRSWAMLEVPSPTIQEAEAALLGHLIGDGCTLSRHVVQYTTTDRSLAEMVAQLAIGNLSRERAFRVGEIVQSEELIRLSQSDVYWDRIASIEEAGEEEVFDLEVPGHHNFVAGDIIVHNSLEQDADVVMFIYREEMYKPETEKQHIADIIVAKHRHGPTRTVQLFFREQLAQFLDAETRIRPVEFA